MSDSIPQTSSDDLDDIISDVRYNGLDTIDAKVKLQRLISREAARLTESVIGEDYPEPTQRYSGGIWLGGTQLNWTDIERAKRHFASRNAEKAEARQRLADITKGQA